MIPGALYVMMAGLMLMPVLLADSWATPDSVIHMNLISEHHNVLTSVDYHNM